MSTPVCEGADKTFLVSYLTWEDKRKEVNAAKVEVNNLKASFLKGHAPIKGMRHQLSMLEK